MKIVPQRHIDKMSQRAKDIIAPILGLTAIGLMAYAAYLFTTLL